MPSGLRKRRRGAKVARMTPSWLTRLNACLTWLNPTLGLVAAVLAVLVAASVTDRLQGLRTVPAVQAAQVAPRSVVPACALTAMPQEMRDLLLYD